MSDSATPQTREQLLAAFAESDPPGAITSETMRNLVASVTIVPEGTSWAFPCTGTNQSTSNPLTGQLTVVASGPASGGVQLPAAADSLGAIWEVWNATVNTIFVYVLPTDTLGTTAVAFAVRVSLGTGNHMKFAALAPGFWYVA